MDHLLVLQFPFQPEQDKAPFLALEDDLLELLEDSVEIEGSEEGTGTINLFLTTRNAAKTFERLKKLLASQSLLDTCTAASRHVDEEDFKVLWTKNPAVPFSVH